ncbi:MAG: HAMP domain-containing sensor histidine kinase [Candidatus Bathyarchaeota archaeon]|nr:HAMP domain-containing sensor histidine kinase [Candidatus Bathyarchaeota archaeon]
MKKELSPKNINEYKLTEVVSVVSHQLKTPLSVIKGYLEVLISEDLGKLNRQQKEYVDDILENTNKMIVLVRDLLEVTKIESNRIEIRPKPTNLKEMLEEIREEFADVAKAKNCHLSLKISGKIPPINIDPIKIKETIANLVSNAIFYNRSKGKVMLSLSKKGKKVIFCCEDTGVGIKEEDKDRLFTKFFRSEESLTLAPKGSGLGLFISKAIVEKSGGEMWFRSKKDKGSVFCFSLPIGHSNKLVVK